MKKLIVITAALMISGVSFGKSLISMNQDQVKQAFVGKTSVSIPTDNLNGRDINNTFSVYLDNHGNLWGKMAQKPANQPQTDKGVYSIKSDGTVYLTWQHWDGAKKLCFHIYKTNNAFITIDCANVFHSVFLKDAISTGNHL